MFRLVTEITSMQVSGLEVHHESKKPLQWDLDLDSVTDFGWRKGRPISSPSLIVTTNRPMIDQLLATTITIDPIQPSTWTTDDLDHHQSPAARLWVLVRGRGAGKIL